MHITPEKCAHGIRKYVVKIRFQKCYHFLVLEHVDSSLSAVLSTFPAPKPPRNIVRFDNSLWEEIRLQISSFRPHFYTLRRPGNTRHQEIPTFRPHPLELTHFIKIPSGKHLEAMTFGLHSLELTVFKHMSRQLQAQSSLHQHSRNSTVNTSFLPPHWRRLVNNDTGLSPSLGQTHQLTLCMLCKQRN